MTKNDSSETLRTTESMKKKAHLFSRCLISIMKVFRMCKKTRKNKGIAWKNTKMFFYVFGRGLMTFISFADLAAFFATWASRFCSRAFFLSSLSLISGQETLAFCIASRCVTACFVSRVSLFRILRTWSNQWTRMETGFRFSAVISLLIKTPL